MATARKQSGGSKTARKPKPAQKAKAKAPAKKAAPARKSAPAKKAKPVMKSKPAAKAPARKPAKPAPSKSSARPAGKAAMKSSPKPAAAKPAGKLGAKPAAPALKVIGKPAVKGVVGKPAVKGGKAVPLPPPAKPVSKGPPRLVPATAAAKAAAIAAAKPATGKKASTKAPPEVRPLGVLPPEAMAKPRFASLPPRPAAPKPRPVAPVKPAPPRKGGDERLSPEDLKHFEQRLLTERAKIMREMGHLESTVLKVNPRDAAGELSGYSFHMADAGTDSMEREKAFDIASKEGRLLMEIDDALRRLYNGNYGNCENTGKPISRARLEALPWARLSLEEQEKLEKEQRAGRALAKSEE